MKIPVSSRLSASRGITLFVMVAAVGACGEGGRGAFPRPVGDWNPETYVVYRTDSSLAVDGVLDEPAWEAAPWSADFVDIRGAGAPQPRYRTRMKMLWDDDYLYVAAELEEPNIWATLTTRDAVIYHDNDFEVFLDPDGDTHSYYELEVNALGTEWDLMLLKPYRDGGPAINAWDIQGLETGVAIAGTINDPSDADVGWVVELAFPWVVLREAAGVTTPPRDGERWRANFSRVEWQTGVEGEAYVKLTDPVTGETMAEDNWVWSPQGLINMHYPEMWGVLRFSERSAGAGVDTAAVPTIVFAKRSLYRIYYAQRDWYARHGRYAATLGELGLLDVEWGLFRAPPEVGVTEAQFLATATTAAGETLHLTQDGRIRVMSEIED